MALRFVLMAGCVFWAKCAPGNDEFQAPWQVDPLSDRHQGLTLPFLVHKIAATVFIARCVLSTDPI